MTSKKYFTLVFFFSYILPDSLILLKKKLFEMCPAKFNSLMNGQPYSEIKIYFLLFPWS